MFKQLLKREERAYVWELDLSSLGMWSVAMLL